MEAKTYTNRNNARRAGIAAGVPSNRVQITVHKNGDKVRFGWKEGVVPIKPVVTTATLHDEQNGVKRPAPGGVCREVWDWLDANPNATLKNAKAIAPDHSWNLNNVACELYAWRKFMGISGRQQKAA